MGPTSSVSRQGCSERHGEDFPHQILFSDRSPGSSIDVSRLSERTGPGTLYTMNDLASIEPGTAGGDRATRTIVTRGHDLPESGSWGNGFSKRVVLIGLRGYKRFVSPALPPACRFYPSCSEYAMEAIERYGLIHGSWRAVKRLLKCHPLHRGGFDPVE